MLPHVHLVKSEVSVIILQIMWRLTMLHRKRWFSLDFDADRMMFLCSLTLNSKYSAFSAKLLRI